MIQIEEGFVRGRILDQMFLEEIHHLDHHSRIFGFVVRSPVGNLAIAQVAGGGLRDVFDQLVGLEEEEGSARKKEGRRRKKKKKKKKRKIKKGKKKRDGEWKKSTSPCKKEARYYLFAGDNVLGGGVLIDGPLNPQPHHLRVFRNRS
jgi:hypothetical protein